MIQPKAASKKVIQFYKKSMKGYIYLQPTLD